MQVPVCHVCEENETDYCCKVCGEPVCENCCVVPTYMNQLDYALCLICGDIRESRRMEEYEKEYKIQEAIRIKKKAIADKRKATYMKPENVAKRKAAKIERKRIIAEQALERFNKSVKIICEIFRGF